MKPSHTFGSYLKEHRQRNGLSQRTLGGHIGVSHPWIGATERGEKKPLKPKTFDKLCEVLPTMDRIVLETLYGLALIEWLEISGHTTELEHVMLRVVR